MTTEQLIKLIEVFVTFVQAVIWPLLVVFLVFYFRTPLRKFLNDLSEFDFSAGPSGLKATAKKHFEAAALLGAASAKSNDTSDSKQISDEGQARKIADVVSRAVEPKAVRRLAEASVLWVDDNPSNNFYERKALEALGLHFTLSPSTDDALEKIRLNKYDVIISDMGRPPDTQAGYTLLAEKRKLGDTGPFIIYAGSNKPEHKMEARQKGAFGTTNDPQELFQLVLSAIQSD